MAVDLKEVELDLKEVELDLNSRLRQGKPRQVKASPPSQCFQHPHFTINMPGAAQRLRNMLKAQLLVQGNRAR